MKKVIVPTINNFGPIKTKEGEYIEEKVRRITENGEPIEDGAPIIYTERKDGVNPVTIQSRQMGNRAKRNGTSREQ